MKIVFGSVIILYFFTGMYLLGWSFVLWLSFWLLVLKLFLTFFKIKTFSALIDKLNSGRLTLLIIFCFDCVAVFFVSSDVYIRIFLLVYLVPIAVVFKYLTFSVIISGFSYFLKYLR